MWGGEDMTSHYSVHIQPPVIHATKPLPLAAPHRGICLDHVYAPDPNVNLAAVHVRPLLILRAAFPPPPRPPFVRSEAVPHPVCRRRRDEGADGAAC